jgi:hypothetical protein
MNTQESAIGLLPRSGQSDWRGAKNGLKKPVGQGTALDLLSRELESPAARIAAWHQVFLDAGQEAWHAPPSTGSGTGLLSLEPDGAR